MSNLYENHILRTMCSDPKHRELETQLAALTAERNRLRERLVAPESVVVSLEDLDRLAKLLVIRLKCWCGFAPVKAQKEPCGCGWTPIEDWFGEYDIDLQEIDRTIDAKKFNQQEIARLKAALAPADSGKE